jgi:hypothetical protein
LQKRPNEKVEGQPSHQADEAVAQSWLKFAFICRTLKHRNQPGVVWFSYQVRKLFSAEESFVFQDSKLKSSLR